MSKKHLVVHRSLSQIKKVVRPKIRSWRPYPSRRPSCTRDFTFLSSSSRWEWPARCTIWQRCVWSFRLRWFSPLLAGWLHHASCTMHHADIGVSVLQSLTGALRGDRLQVVEEHGNKTRKALLLAAKATCVLNLLLILDDQPASCCVAGFVAHALYHILLSSRVFPHHAWSDPIVLAAMGGFVANSGLWVVNFRNTRYTNEYVASFLLITAWAVPFVLSLCMAGGAESLPGAGSMSRSLSSQELSRSSFATRGVPGANTNGYPGTKRRSWVLGTWDSVRQLGSS